MYHISKIIMSLKEYCLKNDIQLNLPDELPQLSEEKIPYQTIGEIFDMLKKRYKHMPDHIKINAYRWKCN
jgi:hypothetical protein